MDVSMSARVYCALPRTSVVLVVGLLATVCVNGQHRNDNWLFEGTAFVTGGRLNFTSGYPVLDTAGLYTDCNGFGTISDTLGNLLFSAASYADEHTSTIYDANLDPMPDGIFSPSYASAATQGSLILPRPGNDQLYDVIYVNGVYPASSGSAFHVVVDMVLNGTLGNVVSGSMHQLVDSMTEKLTGTLHANGTDYWIVMHKRDDSRFMAFRLTASGLDTVPTISWAGAPHTFPDRTDGQMQISHSGDRIALCTRRGNNGPEVPSLVQIHHFDNATGEVTYWLDLPGHRRTFGCEISPNGCIFYVAGMDTVGHYIDQYDLCREGGDTMAILDSRARIYQFPTISYTDMPAGMATASDGKIYITHSSTSRLAAINSPDLQGAACDLLWNAFDIAPAVLGSSFCNQIKSYHDSKLATALPQLERHSAMIVSPNPAHGTTWLHLPEKAVGTRVIVTDALGRRVEEIKLSSFMIQPLDIARLLPGVYVVTVHGHDGLIGQQRLVVE